MSWSYYENITKGNLPNKIPPVIFQQHYKRITICDFSDYKHGFQAKFRIYPEYGFILNSVELGVLKIRNKIKLKIRVFSIVSIKELLNPIILLP